MMTEQSDYRPGGRPLTGRLVLLMILGFFGVMLHSQFHHGDLCRENIQRRRRQ